MPCEIINLEAQLIGTPDNGVNLYQVPNATMGVLEDVINATWCLALEKSDAASASVDAITGSAMFDPSQAPTITAGTVSAQTAAADAVASGMVTTPAEITVDALSAGTITYPTAAADSVTAGTVTAGTVTSSSVTADAVFASPVASSEVTSASVTSGSVTVPVIVAPPVNIPANIEMADLWDEWKTQYLEIAAWLVAQYTTWIATYAPNNQALYTAAESSLLAALQTDSYLPASTQAQIWGDDAARILSDKLRAQDAVVAQFASRRFPMPAAASISAVMQIEQKAQDALAESSRKIAIMSVEQYRFVIQQAMAARDMVLKAANDYIKSLASAPDMASKLLGIGYDIQTKLISSAASFYSADANAKDVMAKVGEFNVSSALDASKTTSSLALDASKTTSSLALDASKTTSSLALEASKTTSSLSLEASKTTSSLSLDASKTTSTLALEASKTTSSLALDASKVTASLALDASKTNTGAAIDAGKANTSLAFDADKAFAAFMLDASKTNAGLLVDVGKVNTSLAFDASKANASLGFEASKLNATLATDVSKSNVSLGLEASSKNQATETAFTEFNLKALLGELTTITQQAVALFNNLHVGVTMQAGGSTITTQNQDV